MTPSPPPPVRVVVVTYDSAATLPACLASLSPQVRALGGELVVVDNGSRDDSVAVARRHGATVIESGGNHGFAVGCNLGARGAAADLVVLVNPDTQLDRDCLELLLAAHRSRPDAGPIGGRPRRQDGSYDPRGVLGRPRLRGAVAFALGLDTAFRGTRWLDPEHGPTSLPDGEGATAVEAVSGAVMAVPRALWERLGGFDEGFFLYGEDVDLCLRAGRAGWQPVVARGAGYHHVGGLRSDGTAHRRVLLFRGKVELYRRHLGPVAARLAVLALEVGALVRGLPACADGSRLARRAAPWRDLYRARHLWRGGHEVAAPGRPS